MAAQKGVTLIIKRGDGAAPTEAFTALAGIRSKTVNQNAAQIDITTDDDINASGASFRTHMAGINEFSVSGSGVAKTKADFNALQAAYEAGTVANYQVEFTNYGTWEGAMFVQSFTVTGEMDGAVTFDITLMNNDAIDYTPAT